jgi:glycosyltransferase involved in cell wall biosynthesis
VNKICFVLPSLNGGGAERAAVHIINSLDGRRWQRAMYLFERTGPYLEELSPAIELSSGEGGSRFQRWQALRKYIANTRPDVVVSFLSYFSVLTAVKASGVPARVVFNQQTPMTAFLTDRDYPWRHTWHKRVFRIVTRLGYAAADLIVTTSRGVSEDLVTAFGVAADHIQIVPNPVDLETVRTNATAPLDAGFQAQWVGPTVVAAGRLADAKNYPLLIDAFAIVRATVDAHLFILGQGDRESAIRARIVTHKLEDAVTLCGFQQNPWKFVAKADVFALTSHYEGFGNVLIEAMACGVPVVATVSAGTRDIVRDDVDGLLVEAHDASSVAAALIRVLTDRALRARLSTNAREGAARFALPAVAAQYGAVFEGLVA